MMPSLDVVMCAVLAGGGCLLAFLGWRSLRAARTFMLRKTTPIGQMTSGPIEIEGVVATAADPLKSEWGAACVFVDTLVEKLKGENNYQLVSHVTDSVAATIEDGSGSCALDLSHVQLRGERRHKSVAGLRTTQVIIPVGGRVLIAGEAVSDGDCGGGGAYRGERIVSRSMAGSKKAPLTVFLGGNRQAIWSFGWVAVVLFSSGISLMLLAAWLVWVSTTVQALSGS